MLLNHHQLMAAYDPADLGPVLPAKLGPVLDSGRVAAWLWGHEHRCMAFKAAHGVRFPRSAWNTAASPFSRRTRPTTPS
ncbi:MAG: hypothetical protein ACR2MP_19125 [Streptosporangiaceae bacterium]